MVNYFPQSATQVYLKTAILGIPDFDFLNFRHIAVKIMQTSQFPFQMFLSSKGKWSHR